MVNYYQARGKTARFVYRKNIIPMLHKVLLNIRTKVLRRGDSPAVRLRFTVCDIPEVKFNSFELSFSDGCRSRLQYHSDDRLCCGIPLSRHFLY